MAALQTSRVADQSIAHKMVHVVDRGQRDHSSTLYQAGQLNVGVMRWLAGVVDAMMELHYHSGDAPLADGFGGENTDRRPQRESQSRQAERNVLGGSARGVDR